MEHRDDGHDRGVAHPHEQRRLAQARAQVCRQPELLLGAGEEALTFLSVLGKAAWGV